MTSNTLKPENLLQKYTEHEWKFVNFSSEQATWQKSAEGSIIQTTRSNDSEPARGSALLLKPLQDKSFDVLYLDLVPGTRYHSGIIFNFLDDNNFALFTINNYSKYTDKAEVQKDQLESDLIDESQLGLPCSDDNSRISARKLGESTT